MKIINKIKNSKIIKNVAWLINIKFLKLFSNLVVGLWLARYLGPEDYGVLMYALSLITILIPITAMGLDSILIREIKKNRNLENHIMNVSFSIRLTSGLLLFLGLNLYLIFWDNSEIYIKLQVFFISFWLIFNSINVIEVYFQSILKAKNTFIVQTITIVFSSIAKIVLILIGSNLIGFSIVILLEQMILFVLYSYSYKFKFNRRLKFVIDIPYYKKLLSMSWPLIISGFSAVIYLKIDQVMLAEMKGSYEVGIYAAAVKIAEMWYFIPSAIAVSIFPKLIKLHQDDINEYRFFVNKILSLLISISLVFSIMVTFSSDIIITVLYGKEYALAGMILSVHIWTSILIFVRAIVSKMLVVEDLIKFSMVSHGLGAATNVIFNIILIPSFGGLGASIATLISYICSTILFGFFTRKTRKISLSIIISFLQIPASIMSLLKGRFFNVKNY